MADNALILYARICRMRFSGMTPARRFIDVEQNIYGTPMTAEITSHLKCQTGTIATCALRRYISNKGNLFAS